MAWRDVARRGLAGSGESRRGKVETGGPPRSRRDSLLRPMRQAGMVWLAEAGRTGTWRGSAGRGAAGHGMVWLGLAWLGAARIGPVRLGEARLATVRHGMDLSSRSVRLLVMVQQFPKPIKERKKKGVDKQRVRQAVRERDGDQCLLCGAPGPGLHLHRVIYGAQGGRYEERNCIQLCVLHHNPVIHASKETWQPLLMDYLNAEGASRTEALRALRKRFAEWLRERHPTG